MQALVISSIYGLLAFDEHDMLKETLFQDLSPKELAPHYLMLKQGEEVPEIFAFLNNLKDQGYTQIEYEDPAFYPMLNKIQGLLGILTENPNRIMAIREQMATLFKSLNAEVDLAVIRERTKILSEYMIAAQIAEQSTAHDAHIKQAVESINDLDRSVNFFSSRLREWYGLHFPELTDKLMDDHYMFALMISTLQTRDAFIAQRIESELGIPAAKSNRIADKAQRSMGGALGELDVATITNFARRILDLYDFRKELEAYISTTLDGIAPNMKAVIGAPIAAKFIALAGGLKNLAFMPSSTLQVLGAEKALFKALRSGGKTPKYGILFQWHKVRSEKPHLRGKIARMVAGKISILAKVDYYKGEFVGDRYKGEIDSRIELLRKQYPLPPKKSPERERSGGYSMKDRKRKRPDHRGSKKPYKSHDNKGRSSTSKKPYKSHDNKGRSSTSNYSNKNKKPRQERR